MSNEVVKESITEVEYQLGRTNRALETAKEYVKNIPDKQLQKKVGDAQTSVKEAGEHIKKRQE